MARGKLLILLSYGTENSKQEVGLSPLSISYSDKQDAQLFEAILSDNAITLLQIIKGNQLYKE